MRVIKDGGKYKFTNIGTVGSFTFISDILPYGARSSAVG
jgi:hypothetical protein